MKKNVLRKILPFIYISLGGIGVFIFNRMVEKIQKLDAEYMIVQDYVKILDVKKVDNNIRFDYVDSLYQIDSNVLNSHVNNIKNGYLVVKFGFQKNGNDFNNFRMSA